MYFAQIMPGFVQESLFRAPDTPNSPILEGDGLFCWDNVATYPHHQVNPVKMEHPRQTQPSKPKTCEYFARNKFCKALLFFSCFFPIYEFLGPFQTSTTTFQSDPFAYFINSCGVLVFILV